MVSRVATDIAFAALGVWALLSILVLFPRLEGRLRPRDPLRLLPQWKFFAPTPSTSDYFVLYRDTLPGGVVTGWTELRQAPRRWWSALLYPAKRERKVELDAAMELARLDPARTLERSLSMPYLLLLNRVSRLRRWGDPESVQFAVATRDLHGEEPEMRILCVSGPHRLT